MYEQNVKKSLAKNDLIKTTMVMEEEVFKQSHSQHCGDFSSKTLRFLLKFERIITDCEYLNYVEIMDL